MSTPTFLPILAIHHSNPMAPQHANPMALYFEPAAPASCVVASSHLLPLLAAGTLPAPGVSPSISILRASAAIHGDRDDPRSQIFSAVDCFAAPAGFRSVSWSAASSHTSAAGFVAGGLEDGVVALWDSKIVRDLLGDGDEDGPREQSGQAPEENYFATASKISEPAQQTPLLQRAEDDDDDDAGWDDWDNTTGEIYESEGQSFVYGKEPWRPRCLNRKRDNLARSKFPATDDEALAFFRHRDGSAVDGLQFNNVEPQLLASAAGNKLVLWDVSYSRSDSVSSWEYIAPSPMTFTSLSWSQSRDTFGCTSREGDTTVFDIRTKSPSTSLKSFRRSCSCIQFSPKNEHELVISFDDSSKDHSVSSWDTRKLNTCLWKLCDHSRGTNSLSWSRLQDLILVGTNDSKINVLSTQDQKIISKLTASSPCIDLKWSNTVKGSFVASFDRKLIAYALQ